MRTYYCDFSEFQRAYAYAAKRSHLGHNVERIYLTEHGRRVQRVYFSSGFLNLDNALNVKVPT